MNVASAKKGMSGDDDEPNATGATVLVVEDYDELRFVVSLTLRMSGYRVLEAANGQEAIEIARREHPDLILMDLNLPVVDGLTAARRIREQAELRDVKIVAVTAYGNPEHRHKALAAGCDDFMTKPVNLDQLEKKLQSLLGHKFNDRPTDDLSQEKEADAPRQLSARAGTNINQTEELMGEQKG